MLILAFAQYRQYAVPLSSQPIVLVDWYWKESVETHVRTSIALADNLQALLHARLADKNYIEHYKAIFTSTYGILFFGTPHQGGNGVEFGQLIQNIASVAIQTNKGLLDHLEKDSAFLEQLQDEYKFIAHNFDTKFCYETVPMRIFGISKMVMSNTTALASVAHDSTDRK